MFDRLADLLHRRSRLVAAAALLITVACGVLGGPVAGLLSGGGFADPHAPSSEASAQLARATGLDPQEGLVVLVRPGSSVAAGPGQTKLRQVAGALRSDPAIARVVTPEQSAALISADGREAYLVADLHALSGGPPADTVKRLQQRFAGDASVTLGGASVANVQVGSQVQNDLAKAEALAFPILFALLFFVFRGVVTALLPLAVGGLTILATFLGLRVVNSLTDMSIFAVNLVTGLGLGLAIDYSLLIVSRYREEMRRHGPGVVALQRTLRTAGRTVVFSSLTVAAALASLLVFPLRFLYSMGAGGVIVTLSAAVVALTVLPALLALLGPRIDALSPRTWRRDEQASGGGAWARIAHGVMRRPGTVAVATAALLVTLGLPFLSIRFTTVDASVLPPSSSARQVNDVLRHDFDPRLLSAAELVVQAGPEQAQAVEQYAGSVAQVDGVRSVPPPLYLGNRTWDVRAVLADEPFSDHALQATRAIRGLSPRMPALVTGDSAVFLDLQSTLAGRLPLAVALVALATLLVLFAATGSVLLPLKAVLMNALSLIATFGFLVLVFQNGHLTGLLSYTSQGALESTQPVLLFAISFGLSTDYGVFLLLRIKEAHDAGLGTRESVAVGLERTGRIVTAAALLFCIAIGAFATSQIIFIKELGVGTAFAVLLDASIVRALLVPALMALLGEWNWWAPRPLRRLHQRLGLARIEGDPGATAPAG